VFEPFDSGLPGEELAFGVRRCCALSRTVASVPEEFRSVRAQLPPQVEDLVASFRDPFTQIEFLSVIVDGGVLEPVLAGAAAATRMVGPYALMHLPNGPGLRAQHPVPVPSCYGGRAVLGMGSGRSTRVGWHREESGGGVISGIGC
jgi:hypothetical protein